MSKLKLPDNWSSLQTEEILMGGIRKKIKYDQDTNTVYMLKENGDWTGEKAHPTTRKTSEEAKKNTNACTEAPTLGDQDTITDTTPIRRKKKHKFGLTAILIVIIAILSGTLLFQNIDLRTPIKYHEVIIAKENIQPGEKIYGKLAKYKISQEEYLQHVASGGIYTMDNYEAIKQFFATTFIPEGGIIAYNNVGMEFNAQNPWTMENTPLTLKLPIDVSKEKLDELLWGNRVTITVTATRPLQTEARPEATRPTSPEIEGSTEDVVYRTDTYVLRNMTITDVLNKQKNSLYGTYAALAAIPEIYQSDCITTRYSSQAQAEMDTPFYICIPVTRETVDWWQRINNDKRNIIEVSIKVTGADCNTDFKVQTHVALKAMISMLQEKLNTTS